jgi:hypothetical protein
VGLGIFTDLKIIILLLYFLLGGLLSNISQANLFALFENLEEVAPFGFWNLVVFILHNNIISFIC